MEAGGGVEGLSFFCKSSVVSFTQRKSYTSYTVEGQKHYTYCNPHQLLKTRREQCAISIYMYSQSPATTLCLTIILMDVCLTRIAYGLLKTAGSWWID